MYRSPKAVVNIEIVDNLTARQHCTNSCARHRHNFSIADFALKVKRMHTIDLWSGNTLVGLPLIIAYMLCSQIMDPSTILTLSAESIAIAIVLRHDQNGRSALHIRDYARAN